ncbi:DUF6622 family protein [Ottowia thiooxydans]|uniref:DUF6622 family protein n=1 Tax=Ottowia thiooxydans TaxID=219182 RepID=UPI0003F85249|nr:DUF6622 family protein [Ottowia thiooxydans]
MLLTDLLIQHPEAIADIVRQTPVWVGGLLAGLSWLGFSATRARNVHIARLALMPVAMGGLALWGVYSAFGAGGRLAELLAVWAACYAAVIAIGWNSQPLPGTSYQATSRSFHVPGSWVPLLLTMVIFLMKYSIGVQLAMEPSLASNAGFEFGVTALYGALSGMFAARSLRVLRLARPLTPSLLNPT